MARDQSVVLPFKLRMIYLRSGTAWMDSEFNPLLPGQQLMPLFRTGEGHIDGIEAIIDENGKQTQVHSCAFTNRFDFAYTKSIGSGAPAIDEDIEKKIIAKVTADITVDYLVNPSVLDDMETLKRWAASNVMLHAWPYWREFCHSNLLRMNLPVTMIPIMQLSLKENHGDTKSPSGPQKKAPPKRSTKRPATK